MPTIIKLIFPAGRYHATPWGRNVNEGVAEWPPSPWRLLRSVIAVWKRTCADIPEEQIKRILESLASPPRFRLPPHRVAHSRHYMPLGKKSPKEMSGGGTTLIFDTFVSINRNTPLFVGWPDVELLAEDRQTLARLLANLSSLGRAESWVYAELCDHVVDLGLGEGAKDDPNPIPVFCVDPRSAFGKQHYPTHDPKKLASGKVNPADYLFDCPQWHLCLDTETIHAQRWPTVPGTRWVNYTRTPDNAGRQRHRPERRRPHRTISVVRFLIDGKVLPRTIDTLPFAEVIRSTVLRHAKHLGITSSTLSGHDPDGRRLDHRHTYYIPTSDEDDAHHLTHLTLYARAGFNDDEMKILESLRCVKVGFDEKQANYQLRVIGMGEPKDFNAKIFGSAKEWVSATPFVAHRYPKGEHTIERNTADLINELGIGVAAVDQIEPSKYSTVPLREFKRVRRKDHGQPRPFARLRLRFANPISGPVCLGYGAHFGLGLFIPVANHE